MENNHTLFISDFIAVTGCLHPLSSHFPSQHFPQVSLQAILPTLLLLCGETASVGGHFPPPRVVGIGAKLPTKIIVQALESRGMPIFKNLLDTQFFD